jgi:hypothetical protein
LPYFVALLSPEENILQRQAFTVAVEFEDNGIGAVTEEHTIKIPLATGEDGAYKYKVVAGFIMSPEQLAYNKGDQ